MSKHDIKVECLDFEKMQRGLERVAPLLIEMLEKTIKLSQGIPQHIRDSLSTTAHRRIIYDLAKCVAMDMAKKARWEIKKKGQSWFIECEDEPGFGFTLSVKKLSRSGLACHNKTKARAKYFGQLWLNGLQPHPNLVLGLIPDGSGKGYKSFVIAYPSSKIRNRWMGPLTDIAKKDWRFLDRFDQQEVDFSALAKALPVNTQAQSGIQPSTISIKPGRKKKITMEGGDEGE